MTKHLYKKNLLALAVAGAALSAQAVTLNGGHLVLEPSYQDSVSVTGKQTGAFAVDLEKELAAVVTADGSHFAKNLTIDTTIDIKGKGVAAIDLWDSQIGGDLTIAGKLKVVGSEVFLDEEYDDAWGATGVTIEGDLDWEWDGDRYENSYTSSVGGSILNKADITVEGPLAAGFILSDMKVAGDVVNEGTILAKGEYLWEDEDDEWKEEYIEGARALELDFVDIAGNVHNKGTIRAEGINANAVWVLGGIGGKFINDGTIEATGKSVDATWTDKVENTTESEHQAAMALVLTSDIEQVRNNGRIVASGEGGVGLAMAYGHFTSDEAAIINTGLIRGEKIAVYLAGMTGENGQVRFVNRGDIVSSHTAIQLGGFEGDPWEMDAGEPVDLHWEKGTVSGDLIGLRNVEVVGSATFNRLGKTELAKIELAENGKLSIGTQSTAGKLTLGQPHTEVAGDLSLAGGSSLGLTLRTATQQDKAVLKVSGTAEFAADSQITLVAKGSDFDKAGAEYVLVQAGALVGAPSVTSSSLLLKVDATKTRDSQIVATVTGKGEAEILDAVAGSNASQADKNAAKVGDALLSGVMDQMPAGDPIVDLLNGTPEQQKKVLQQLTPEVGGGSARAAVSGQSLIGGATAGRTGAARGLSSGGAFAQTGVWVQVLNSDGTQDLRDGVPGFDASTTGIAVGVDGRLNEQLTLGLAYSSLSSDVDSEGGNKTEVTGHAFTFYGGFAAGNYFVDGGLTYGLNENEGRRVIGPTLAKATYDSTLLGLNVTAGYLHSLQDRLVIEPQVAVRYSNVEIDAINETGSSAALNTASQTYNVAELGAGMRLVSSLPLGQGTLAPQIKAMVYQDLIGDQVETTSTFAVGGNAFVTTGADPETTSYEIGLGVDYRLGALTLGVSYDYFGRSDYSSDTFGAKLRYDF